MAFRYSEEHDCQTWNTVPSDNLQLPSYKQIHFLAVTPIFIAAMKCIVSIH